MSPSETLRDLLINAVVQNNYSSLNPIQISAYEDQIYICNNAEVPRELFIQAKLYSKHASIPYNPRLAEVFLKSRIIEALGRSFEKIREACEEFNASLPTLKISENGMMVHCLPCDKYVELMNKNSASDFINVTGTETNTETGIETDTERKKLP